MINNKSVFFIILLLYLSASFPLWSQVSKAENEFNFARRLLEDDLHLLAAEQFKHFTQNYPNNEWADDALLLAGESYFEVADYKLAFDAFKELEIGYATSPLLPKARFYQGECQEKLENFRAAARLFERVPVFHPESEKAPNAYLAAARAYRRAREVQPALNSLRKLIDEYPDVNQRLDAHVEMVHIYLDQENYSEAMNQVNGVFRVFGADMEDPRIYLLKAEIFGKLAQVAEAKNLYLKILSGFPNSPAATVAAFELANFLRLEGNYEESLKYFNRVLTDSSNTELLQKAYWGTGDILSAQQKYEEAFSVYQKAISFSSGRENLQLQRKIVKVLARLKRWTQAETFLKEMIAYRGDLHNLDSKSVQFLEFAHRALVDVLVKSKKYRAALKEIQQYLTTVPDRRGAGDMLYKKAEIFEFELQDFTRSARQYDLFMETYPAHPKVDEAQMAIARCYEKLGQYPLAVKEYEKYLTRFTAGDGFSRVKDRLQTLISTIDLENADNFEPFFQMLSKLQKNTAITNLHYELGRFYFNKKKYPKAIEHFQNALSQLSEKSQKDEVLFKIGESFLFLAKNAVLIGGDGVTAAYRDSAAVYFKTIASANAKSKWQEESAFRLLQIELDSLLDVPARQNKLLETKIEWENRYSPARYLDYVLLHLTRSIRANAAPIDTSLLKQALISCQQIIENYPESNYLDEAYFYESTLLHDMGQDSLARIKLDNFIAAHADSPFLPQALFFKAQLAKKQENYAAAVNILQEIRSHYFYSNYSEKARTELAEIYFLMKDFESAIEYDDQPEDDWKKIVGENISVRDELSWYRQGQSYEHLQQYNQATQKYLAFIRAYPQHPQAPTAMLAVARIATKLQNTAFAREYYLNVVKHAVQSEQQFRAQVALGDIYFQQELFDQAHTHYLAARQLLSHPDSLRYPLEQSIRCKYKLRQFTEANLAFEKFKKRYKDADEMICQLLQDKGHAYIAEKNFTQAEKVFKKLKDDFKKTDCAAKGEFGLGAIYLITNHTEKALKILTEIPDKYPDSEVTPYTYFNLGDFYFKSNQIQNAINAFNQILQHPKAGEYNQKALNYLIQCYVAAKMWDQAIAHLRNYLERFPNASDHYLKKIELAKFLMYLKEYQRAIAEFKILLPNADNETHAEIQFYIGQCYHEMGRWQQAAAEYLKVRYLTKPTKLPWHVTAQFEASKCLIRQGEVEQATKMLERIIAEQGSESNFGRFAKQKLTELRQPPSSAANQDAQRP